MFFLVKQNLDVKYINYSVQYFYYNKNYLIIKKIYGKNSAKRQFRWNTQYETISKNFIDIFHNNARRNFQPWFLMLIALLQRSIIRNKTLEIIKLHQMHSIYVTAAKQKHFEMGNGSNLNFKKATCTLRGCIITHVEQWTSL